MVDVAYKPIEKPGKIYPGGTLTAPKFMPTYYEWLLRKGVQISKKTGTAGSGIIYEVPIDKTFFLTSAILSDGGQRIYWGTEIPILDSTTGAGAVSISFSIPLKIPAGAQIKLESSSGATYGIIHGFLIKNSNFPTF